MKLMHLAEAFIQSGLHCIECIADYTFNPFTHYLGIKLLTLVPCSTVLSA